MRRRINDPVLAPLVVLVLLQAAEWFGMLASDRSWVGSWKSGLDVAVGSVIIAGPMVSAIAAATFAARRHGSVPVLAVTAVRQARGWYDPALRIWLLAAVSFLALVAEVTALAVVHGLPVSPRELVIVPFALGMLLVHALIGTAVGLRARILVAAPLAAALSFGSFILATEGHAPRVFITGGDAGSLVGERYHLAGIVLLVAVVAALVVAGIAATGWWALRTAVPVTIVVVALCGSVLLTRVMGDQGRLESVDLHYRCDGATPRICVAREAPRILPDAVRRMRRATGPLRAIGAEVPGLWKETHLATSDDLEAGDLSVNLETGTRMTSDDVENSLSTPAICSGFGAAEPRGSLDSRLLLMDWLGLRNHLADQPFTDTPRSWFFSKASEAWVRSTYRLLRGCRLDELHLP